jgi:hypothetical protein
MPEVLKSFPWHTTKRNLKFSMYHQYFLISIQNTLNYLKHLSLETLADSKDELCDVASNVAP